VILLLLGVGCGEPEEAVAPPFEPAYGDWTALFGATWEGDCALDDPDTYEHAEQPWILDTYREGFAVRDLEGYWYGCVLDGTDFVCPLPVTADDFASLGYDIQATYTPTWEGTFSDPSHLSGDYHIDAACTGADCGMLTGYGAGFTFPCSVSASLEASAD
jgi:hypothetical protein